MSEITNPQLQELLTTIQKGYTMPIKVEIDGPASGVLVHSQSDEQLAANGDLVVHVSDTTDVDYTLSHELLHMYFTVGGYPQLQYHLLTGTPEVDRQHYAVATALSSAAIHIVIAAWQRAHDLLGVNQETKLIKGFEETLSPEPAAGDQLLIYRTVSLLDHMTLFENGGAHDQRTAWAAKYPRAYEIASALYDTLTVKSLDTPFAYRRAVVNVFGRFNALMSVHGYRPLDLAEFVTVPPVLSARQLRLSLNQVFELKHSAYRDEATKQEAFVALGKGDGQNAFVLPLKDTTPAAFQTLYQRPVGELLKEYDCDYSMR